MDLVRSVTKRVKRTDAVENRSGYSRKQISMPVALLSTTNPLTNVCDLAEAQKRRDEAEELITPSTPTRSSLDDDSNSSSPSLASTPATSIGEASPDREHPPGTGGFAGKAMPLREQETMALEAPPCIPKRAISHSKRAHEQLARKRSLKFSRLSLDQSSTDSTHSGSILDTGRTAPSSTDFVAIGALGPFTRELEQLSEVAEQFGGAARGAAIDDDLEVLSTRGLMKFDAKDYIDEIQSLWFASFCEGSAEQENLWI